MTELTWCTSTIQRQTLRCLFSKLLQYCFIFKLKLSPFDVVLHESNMCKRLRPCIIYNSGSKTRVGSGTWAPWSGMLGNLIPIILGEVIFFFSCPLPRPLSIFVVSELIKGTVVSNFILQNDFELSKNMLYSTLSIMSWV